MPTDRRQLCCENHLATTDSVQSTIDPAGVASVHQQRLAEVSVDDEIQVLFEEYLIVRVFEQVTSDRRSIVCANVYSGRASER